MNTHWASLYLGMHFEWPARFVARVLNDLMQPLFWTAINDFGLTFINVFLSIPLRACYLCYT